MKHKNIHTFSGGTRVASRLELVRRVLGTECVNVNFLQIPVNLS